MIPDVNASSGARPQFHQISRKIPSGKLDTRVAIPGIQVSC
jgi:hypothetical protein